MTCAQFKGSKRIVLPLGLALSAAHIAFTPPGRGLFPLAANKNKRERDHGNLAR